MGNPLTFMNHFQKRLEGTHVTIETFLAWKNAFDAELAEMKKVKGKVIIESTKPTGLYSYSSLLCCLKTVMLLDYQPIDSVIR